MDETITTYKKEASGILEQLPPKLRLTVSIDIQIIGRASADDPQSQLSMWQDIVELLRIHLNLFRERPQAWEG